MPSASPTRPPWNPSRACSKTPPARRTWSSPAPTLRAGGFSASVLQRIKAVPGLAAAVPTVHIQTSLVEDAGQAEIGLNFFGASAGGLTLYGIDPLLDPQAREYKIVAGEFLSPQGQGDQVVLVKSFADENEIELGKSVAIITDSGVEKLRVVGLMAKEGPGQLNNGSFGVIPLETAQKLFYRNNKLDQIDIIASPENTSTEALASLRSSLQSALGNDYAVTYPASQGQRMTQMLGSYQIGLNFLSGMALFVGAFLIYNAFSMTVVERTREFGMLRTVGMTRPRSPARCCWKPSPWACSARCSASGWASSWPGASPA